MTEWHVRYGGRGVMIYRHVERQSVCIHSQLKRCSSSEVAAMIDGVLRHDTEMEVEKTYVDSHGQSEVAFAFCRMLGFELLPRLKAIASQRLHLPVPGTAYKRWQTHQMAKNAQLRGHWAFKARRDGGAISSPGGEAGAPAQCTTCPVSAFNVASM